jgi:hypothetical protein
MDVAFGAALPLLPPERTRGQQCQRREAEAGCRVVHATQERPKPAVPVAVLCSAAEELVSVPTVGLLAIAPREEELDGLNVKATELIEKAAEAEVIIDVIYLKLIPK